MSEVAATRPGQALRPGPPIARPTKPLWKQVLEHWGDYLFIAPFFVTFAIFGIYPLLWAFQLSFSRWRGWGPMEFVGLEN